MAKNNESKVTFKVFNQDFNKAMSEMETSTKKMRQELKLEQEQLKLTGSESEKLESVMNNLQKQYDVAKQKTKATTDQLEAIKKQFGENSTEVSTMESKLNSAKIAEQQLANKITITSHSLDRARQAESEASSADDKRRKALSKLQDEQDQLKSSSERLTSEYELQKTSLGKNASEADKMAAAEAYVKKQADIAKQSIANLERQLALTEDEYGKNSTQANRMASRLNAAKSSVANLDNELEKIKSGSGDAADGMEELGRKITAGNFLRASEVLANVADKALELGKAATESASEIADSQQDIQANLGLTGKASENLQGIVKSVFERGVTDSLDSASKAVQNVKMYMGDLNDSDLEKVTNQVIGIGKHTDTDINENVRAASRLMSNFKLSASDSLDLIAAGFQEGLNRSGDFLDTLNEYSPHFKSAGYSAQQMLQIIKNGMENGALNTDKAADAVKEFQIRLGDGSFNKIVGSFSKDTQGMFKQWQKGKATVADVAQSVSKDLNKMSPKDQQIALSNLSSQFEDLGVNGAKALFSVGDAFKDTTGKAEEFSKQSPGDKWQQSLREVKDSLIPIGQDIITALKPIVDLIGSLAKGFSSLPEPLKIFIEILGGLVTVLAILTPIIVAASIAFFALDASLWPILAIIAAVALVITGVILLIKNWGKIVDWLKGVWQSFVGFIQPLWQSIVNIATKIWNGLVDVFKFIFLLIKEVFSATWTIISSTMIAAWRVIIALTKPIWEPIATFFTALWKGVQNVISTVWNGIKSFFSSTWNGIVSIAHTIFDPIGRFFSDMWNGIKSVTSSVWNGIKSVISNVWNGIKSTVSGPIEWVRSKVSAVWNGIESVTSRVWNGIKNAIITPINAAKNAVSNVIDTIKGYFSRLKINLPHIKLPHFKVTGHFSLSPPSVPHLGVDWYKNGGVFEQASIIGIGESGREAALPLVGHAMDPFADAVGNRLLSFLPQMAQNAFNIKMDNNRPINITVVSTLDGEEVARNQFPHINRMMGDESSIRAMLLGG